MPAQKVAVVIPAYQESALIVETIRSVPSWVGSIVVVDDGSTDDTALLAQRQNDGRVRVVRHERNRGVGAAISTGYGVALEDGAKMIAVMAGDNQMDATDLSRLLAPLDAGEADYVKGNRLAHPRARDMPLLRRLGTRFLARLTSWASGLAIHDSQCGYTAISSTALGRLDLETLWPGYGYPNDLILSLAARGCKIQERPVRPVYQLEKSGLRVWHLLVILFVIARRVWIERAARKPPKPAIQGELSS